MPLINLRPLFISPRAKRKARETAEEARLVRAENEVRVLQSRADSAIEALDARARRNHWRESIQQMIQGAM